MNVSELMTKSPEVCSTSDHMQRAAQIMWERDCGSVPVLDEQGTLVGIVTDRDACMAAYTQGRTLADIPVASVMSKQIHTIGPDASVQQALQVMARHEVRRLPVVDARAQLLGILSVSDFARAARAQRKLQDNQVVDLVHGVSKPRHAAPAGTIVPAARPSGAPNQPKTDPVSAAKRK